MNEHIERIKNNYKSFSKDRENEFIDIALACRVAESFPYLLKIIESQNSDIEQHCEDNDQLRKENERYEMMYENTGAIFNRQNMKSRIEEQQKIIELYKEALMEIGSNKFMSVESGIANRVLFIADTLND